MAFTFLRALGHAIGRSLVEPDRIETARAALEAARRRGVQLDAARRRDRGRRPRQRLGTRRRHPRDSADSQMGLDIGPRTIERFAAVLRSARTIVWNGPMGVFERPPFATGTLEVARAVADAPAFSVDRRRRHDRGREHGGRRGSHRLHLDRRRRVPGVPRGARAAGRRGADGGCDDADPARDRQLEDARHHSRGARRWPPASATGSSGRGASRWRSVRRSPRSRPCPRSSTAAPIALGAQNCHHEPSGAHTGEISPPMLVDLGCRFVLRRTLRAPPGDGRDRRARQPQGHRRRGARPHARAVRR